MASTREAGWEVFQRGDIEGAIALLKRACAEEPEDFEARLCLGAVYGKIGRHQEAITALTDAVQLQPADAQARYNLGVALEQAGFAPQALEVFHQAVTLDPDYTKAREAAARLEAAGHVLSTGADGAPAGAEQAGSLRADGVGSPAHVVHDTVQLRSGLDVSVQAPAWEPVSSSDIPGFVAAPVKASAALPSHGLLSDYSPSPHAPAGPTTIQETYSTELPPPNYNDEIDVPRAIRNFGRILATPVGFFREQANHSGLMSPILMVGVYLAIQLASSLVTNGAQGAIGFVVGLVFSPISLAVSGAWMVFFYLVSALIVHFLGWLFGNRQDFSMSFRACVYADAPRFLVTAIVSLYMAFFLAPFMTTHPITDAEINQALGMPTTAVGGRTSATKGKPPAGPKARVTEQQRPVLNRTTARARQAPTPEMLFRILALAWRKFGVVAAASAVFGLLGWLWSSVLLVMAIHQFQRISTGAAIGVVVLMYALLTLLVVLAVFGFAGIIFAMVTSAMHAGGAAGAGH